MTERLKYIALRAFVWTLDHPILLLVISVLMLIALAIWQISSIIERLA